MSSPDNEKHVLTHRKNINIKTKLTLFTQDVV